MGHEGNAAILVFVFLSMGDECTTTIRRKEGKHSCWLWEAVATIVN